MEFATLVNNILEISSTINEIRPGCKNWIANYQKVAKIVLICEKANFNSLTHHTKLKISKESGCGSSLLNFVKLKDTCGRNWPELKEEFNKLNSENNKSADQKTSEIINDNSALKILEALAEKERAILIREEELNKREMVISEKEKGEPSISITPQGDISIRFIQTKILKRGSKEYSDFLTQTSTSALNLKQ